MTASQAILRAIDQAVRIVQPACYYLTDSNCPKTDDQGNPIYYQTAPNLTSPHTVIMMHEDNLPAFLEACRKNGLLAIDQRDYWKEQ